MTISLDELSEPVWRAVPIRSVSVPITAKNVPRFWSSVCIDDPDGCWQWVGKFNHLGYGLFWAATKRRVSAHRFAYTNIRGSIPAGLVLDHLCRNRGCVNPYHLEAVTGGMNALRGQTPTAENAMKLFCNRGHRLAGTNLRVARKPGGAIERICRSCKAAATRERDGIKPASIVCGAYARHRFLSFDKRAISQHCVRCGFESPTALSYHLRGKSALVALDTP